MVRAAIAGAEAIPEAVIRPKTSDIASAVGLGQVYDAEAVRVRRPVRPIRIPTAVRRPHGVHMEVAGLTAAPKGLAVGATTLAEGTLPARKKVVTLCPYAPRLGRPAVAAVIVASNAEVPLVSLNCRQKGRSKYRPA